MPAGRQTCGRVGVRERALRDAYGCAAFEGETISDVIAKVIECSRLSALPASTLFASVSYCTDARGKIRRRGSRRSETRDPD